MKLYLNCENNNYSLNKKNYLLRCGHPDVEEYTGGEVDYVLNIEPYNFVKGKKWTGIWEIDLLLDRPEMAANNWAQADTIFTAISDIPGRLKHFKTELLFQACDTGLHRRQNVTPEFDIVFSGSTGSGIYEERNRIYELLKQHCDVKFFPKAFLTKYIANSNLARVQFIRSMKTPLGDGELAQRFFECLAIGPVLTNYVPDLERTGLTEGEDYLAYGNDEEMLMKLSYLLQNPQTRERIALNGRVKALRLHTYEQRLETILQRISEQSI